METTYIQEMRIVYKKKKKTTKPLGPVYSPENVAEIARKLLITDTQEQMLMLALNASNTINSYSIVALGNVNSAAIHLRDVFKAALLSNAVSIIVIHNHTSGSLKESEADTYITKQLVQAGKLLGVHVLDHLIITDKEFKSLIPT